MTDVSAAGTAKSRWGRWARRFALGTIVITLVLACGAAFRVWQVARADDRVHSDMILVLGAAQYNGTPSPLFEDRLAHAKELYDEGVASSIVTSGGSRAGDAYSEAEAGARWLIARGIPRGHTLAVPHGGDTLDSVRAVATAAGERGWRSAVVVSDPWHSLRARTMASDSGLAAWSSPSHQAPFVPGKVQAGYILRETGALLYYRLAKTSADDIGRTGNR